MRRKLIQQGSNSYTVTLPIKWVRRLNLEQGDEIKIEEENNELIVSSKIKKKKKQTRLLIEEGYEKNVRFLLNELYRKGYDVIKIKVKDDEIISLIEKLVDDLFFDMEVMKKEDDFCVVEVISNPNIENYNTIIKKIFFIIQESMNIINNSIKKNDYKSLERIKKLTDKYRKYDNFSRRFVFLYKKEEGLEINSVLIHLLILQTDLNRLSKYLSKIKKKPKGIVMFDEVFNFFKLTYEAFLNQNLDSLYECNKNINKAISKYSKKGENSLFLHHCLEILRIMYSLIVPMIGLSIEIPTSKR